MAHDDKALKRYRRDVIKTFTSFYANLSAVLEGTMETFSNKAYSSGLISSSVMTFFNIYQEFKAGLELCRSISEIQERWKSLIDILEDLGGSPRMAGRNLYETLTNLDGM